MNKEKIEEQKEILNVLEENVEVIRVKLKDLDDAIWENEFINIAHEKDEEFDTNFDLNIHFYIDDSVNFKTLKVGDILDLDDEYEILEIEK